MTLMNSKTKWESHNKIKIRNTSKIINEFKQKKSLAMERFCPVPTDNLDCNIPFDNAVLICLRTKCGLNDPIHLIDSFF